MNIFEKFEKLGSWILQEIVCDNDKSILYDVVLDITDDNVSEEDIKELINKKWILKGVKFDTYEIEMINFLELYKKDDTRNFNIISMPTNPIHRYSYIKRNRNKVMVWYVMDKYDYDLGHQSEFCKINYKEIMLYLLNFVEWLHVSKRLVHGDLKLSNVVYNANINQLSIIDFESIDKTDNILCSSSLPVGYYYYGLGCSSDMSYFSYKSELQTIGYILCNILENYANVKWRDIAFYNYYTKITHNSFIYLDLLRNAHFNKMPEIVKKYFEIIKDINWKEEIPNQSIYIELKKLFE